MAPSENEFDTLALWQFPETLNGGYFDNFYQLWLSRLGTGSWSPHTASVEVDLSSRGASWKERRGRRGGGGAGG